jgi:hypothetical protein
MKVHVRAAVAAVALAHTLGRAIVRVHEFEASVSLRMSVRVRDGLVSAYDHGRHCYVTGALPNLYHHGERSHLVIKPEASGVYCGFDHDTSSYFSVSVTGVEAYMFDYKEDLYFAYSV